MDYNIINLYKLTNSLPKIESKTNQYLPDLNKGIEVQLPDGRKLFIRWMQYPDIPTVCYIEREVFPSPWTDENFLYELENRDYNISIIGLIEKKLVTYAVSYIVYDEIHISNLAVVPEFRHLTIGEKILKLTLQIGMEKSCQIAHLEVRRSNVAAISLYQKYGFQIVGVRKNYYQNEREDALLMTKKLEVENIHGVV